MVRYRIRFLVQWKYIVSQSIHFTHLVYYALSIAMPIGSVPFDTTIYLQARFFLLLIIWVWHIENSQKTIYRSLFFPNSRYSIGFVKNRSPKPTISTLAKFSIFNYSLLASEIVKFHQFWPTEIRLFIIYSYLTNPAELQFLHPPWLNTNLDE